MTKTVLIIGGRGRIGTEVARDIAAYCPDAEITITGREENPDRRVSDEMGQRVGYRALDLADETGLREAIADRDLVVHTAGPFHHRDGRVLQTCIELGVNYTDVSDNRGFTKRVLALKEAAQAAGVTAIVNTGIFPGISNSLVRQGVEQLDRADKIHLSYVVGGSGGAGVTVMRTTFLGLQQPFEVWKDGKWQVVNPYSDRETVEFPPPYGKIGVYWFDMPEAFTLPESFPVQTAMTKFGTAPDFYNHLTWMVAHLWPSSWIKNPAVVEFLSQVSYFMTSITDNFSGTGVAVRAAVSGMKEGKPATFCSSTLHESAAVATGIGTGSIAEMMLDRKLDRPGVWPVEQALPTDLFKQIMASRNMKLYREFSIDT
ncbi:saccharopine dehydrogenase family protein [Phormidium sp. CCY1219]|uniref:saccharopine dehydrogenase family protein n=1 Tax=Phormidium sp. CCY1219 TaxID=2886104 RepID=UPI002D1EAFBC|nr:saccharopine dehydrogenase NADP-binding domain-containing protein [Phormidium sp. CCY1219]MEB3827904.1 saccharopine dehydrogenase NADP-binding domain-containing protein [Phormidium sp. CCY1219]